MRPFPGCLATLLLMPAAVAAQPPAQLGQSPAGANHAMSGDQLVANVVLQLERRERIAAHVLLQASLGGRQLQMGGPEFDSYYYQQWDGNREKLRVWCELRGHVEGTPIHLRQVSDGDRLWTDRRTPTGRKVTRVDLRHIRRDLDELADDGSQLQAGQAGVLPIQLELLGERGGLPSLMAGLSDCFTFSPPVSLRLADVPVSGTIGTWKPNRLAEIHPLTTSEEEPPMDGNSLQPLPPRIPASVMLLVGQDDLFPYVIEFRSSEDTAPVMLKDVSQYQMRPQPLMLVHFYERSFTTELDEAKFDYSPGEADWVDLTAARLERLHQTRQHRTAAHQRKSSALR